MPGNYTGGGIGSRVRDAEQAENITRELDATNKLIEILQTQIKSYEDGNRGIKKIHIEEVEILRSLIIAMRKGNELAREQLQRGKNPRDYVGNLQAASGIIDPSNRAARLSKQALLELNMMFQRTVTATKELTIAERRRQQELDKQKKGFMSRETASMVGMLGGPTGSLAAIISGGAGVGGGLVAIKGALDIIKQVMDFHDKLVAQGTKFRESFAMPGSGVGAMSQMGSVVLAKKLDTLISNMTNNTVGLEDLNKTMIELKQSGGASIPLFGGGLSLFQIGQSLAKTQKAIDKEQKEIDKSRPYTNEALRVSGFIAMLKSGIPMGAAYQSAFVGGRGPSKEVTAASDKAKTQQNSLIAQMATFQVGLSTMSRVTGVSEPALLKEGISINRTVALFDNLNEVVGDMMPQVTTELRKFNKEMADSIESTKANSSVSNRTMQESMSAMSGVNVAAAIAATGLREYNIPQEEFLMGISGASKSARLFGLSIFDLINLNTREADAIRRMIYTIEDLSKTIGDMFSPSLDDAALELEYLRNNASEYKDLAPLLKANPLAAYTAIEELANKPKEWFAELEAQREKGGKQSPEVERWTNLTKALGFGKITDLVSMQGQLQQLNLNWRQGFINLLGTDPAWRAYGSLHGGMGKGSNSTYQDEKIRSDAWYKAQRISTGAEMAAGIEVLRRNVGGVKDEAAGYLYPEMLKELIGLAKKNVENFFVGSATNVTVIKTGEINTPSGRPASPKE